MPTATRSSITVIRSTPSQAILPLVRPMVTGFSASGSWPHPTWLYRAVDRRVVGTVTGIRTSLVNIPWYSSVFERRDGFSGSVPLCGSLSKTEPEKSFYKVVTMLLEKQNTSRRTPGLVTWVCWVGLTALGGIVGTFLLSVVSNANTSLNGLLIWCYLASPLIFVFSALFTSGQSLIFGTQEFWSVSLSLAIMSLLFGSLVGLMQGILVIRRLGGLGGLGGLGAAPRLLLWWVTGSAIAWGVGYPLGEQFLASFLWHASTPFSQAATGLVVGTTWGIIGAITGVVLMWVGRARAKVW